MKIHKLYIELKGPFRAPRWEISALCGNPAAKVFAIAEAAVTCRMCIPTHDSAAHGSSTDSAATGRVQDLEDQP